MAVTDLQRSTLLRPINPLRVSEDGKGFSHVQAYDIRAHLNRVFDFTCWDAETLAMELVFEESTESVIQGGPRKGEISNRWTVCYRAQVRLTVGGAVYTEWATGDSSNQPSRADAHDMALKTAESQALKRAASNLGDQFGLSLYAKGSKDALVKGVLGHMDEDAVGQTTEPVVPEDEAVEPKGDPRQRTARVQPIEAVALDPDQAAQLATAANMSDPAVDGDGGVADSTDAVLRFIQQIKVGPGKQNAHLWKARTMAEIARAGLLGAKATDTLTLKQYLEEAGYQ